MSASDRSTDSESEDSASSSSSGFRSRTEGSEFDETADFVVSGERAYNNTSWAYRLPADQEESLRQDHQHHLLSQELPGLYRGPVDDVLSTPGLKRALDIGCGTGIWLAEMAELFPQVDCVGIDIVPSQHDHRHPNCTYMYVEAPGGMAIFPDTSFDVIQIRQMLFTVTDYRGLLAESFRVLRPGGILLLHECSMIMESSWPGRDIDDIAPATATWTTTLWRALGGRGIDLGLFDDMHNAMITAGFDGDEIDSYEYARQFCTDSYPDKSSWLTRLMPRQVDHTLSFVSATRLLLVESGEMSDEEFDDMFEDMSAELRGDEHDTAYLYARWAYWWVIKD